MDRLRGLLCRICVSAFPPPRTPGPLTHAFATRRDATVLPLFMGEAHLFFFLIWHLFLKVQVSEGGARGSGVESVWRIVGNNIYYHFHPSTRRGWEGVQGELESATAATAAASFHFIYFFGHVPQPGAGRVGTD